jgi:excisionase family DNA binding protein
MDPASLTAPAEPTKTAPTLRYLNAAQLADLLSVNRSTIGRWAATDPTMPAIRIAGTVRFRLDQIEAWIGAKTQGQGASRAQRRQRAS